MSALFFDVHCMMKFIIVNFLTFNFDMTIVDQFYLFKQIVFKKIKFKSFLRLVIYNYDFFNITKSDKFFPIILNFCPQIFLFGTRYNHLIARQSQKSMIKSIKITPDECRESFSVNFFLPFFVSRGLADTHAQYHRSRLTLESFFLNWKHHSRLVVRFFFFISKFLWECWLCELNLELGEKTKQGSLGHSCD